jgi:putative MATE family efflux protein
MALGFLKQNTAQRRDHILSGSIPRTLLLLSLPTLMMSVVQCAIPLIDSLFINNIAGTIAASAVTYCTPIINMAVGLAAGLGSAGMAVIGQTNGKGQLEEGRRISTQLIVFSTALGVVFAPLMYLLSFPISAYVDPQISQAVFTYLALNAIVIPFSFLESIYNAIKNANGNPEATFIRMVILLVVKVIFNTIFIAVLRWGVAGAAMASLASNVLITVWMYFELFVKKSPERLRLKGFRPDKAVIGTLVRIGLPTMLSNLMIYAGFYLINNEVEKYGPIVLNGQGIANSITNVCFTLPAAFGSAVTTMVSMNVGAVRSERARSVCWVGSLLSALTAGALIGIIVPLSGSLTVLFTRDPQVLDIANRSLHIYTYSVVGFGVCMTQLGAFIGLGRTYISLVMGVLRIWLLRYLFVLATEPMLGVYSVFWGNLFSNYTAALITTILVLNVKWVSAIAPKAAVLPPEELAEELPGD